jgi:hypothetical protein
MGIWQSHASLAYHSAALKLYMGFMRHTMSAVGVIFLIISSIFLYAIGDSSSVSGVTQVE